MADNNTLYGQAALANNLGANNTAIGSFACYNNLDASNNTALGSNSSFFNTLGENNTAVGAGSLCNNTTGSLNTAVGSSALEGVANQSVGDQNVAVGAQALYVNSGDLNTAIGTYAGESMSVGSYNTLLGASTDASNGVWYSTAVGYGAIADLSNTIVMGGDLNGTFPTVMVPGILDVSGNITTNNGYFMTTAVNNTALTSAIGSLVSVTLTTLVVNNGGGLQSQATNITTLPAGTWIVSGNIYTVSAYSVASATITISLSATQIFTYTFEYAAASGGGGTIYLPVNTTFFYNGSATLSATLSLQANTNAPGLQSSIQGSLLFTRIA
jgi:hypothetical protein